MSTEKLLSSKSKEANNVYTELEEKTTQSQETANDHMESMELAVIKDELIETTTKLILSILAWTNAALIYTALKNTFYVKHWTDYQNGWLLSLISLILALTTIMIPLFCWIDVHSQEFKKHIMDSNPDKEDTAQTDNIKPFFAKVEYLLQSALGFVVSIVLRDVCMLTFQHKVIKNINMDSAAYILYAILWTLIGIWITMHLTNRQSRLKKYLMENDILETQSSNTNDDNAILHFAIKQRYISLIVLTVTYIMAWSWRNAIDSFVLAMYGGNKSTTAHVWVYCIIVTVTISFIVALSEHFYCLYPRDDQSQTLYAKSRTVKETNKLVFDSCQYVVGFAWFDAISITVDSVSTESELFNVFVLYWSVALVMIFISIFATHRINQQKLKEEMKRIGVVEWITKTKQSLQSVISRHPIDDISDGKHEMTYIQYEMPQICSTFAILLITLTLQCWSISGSLFIAIAVIYSVLAMYHDVGGYSVDLGYDRETTGLWLQWVFVVVILCITALVMLYLRKLIGLFRNKRNDLTETFIHLLHLESQKKESDSESFNYVK